MAVYQLIKIFESDSDILMVFGAYKSASTFFHKLVSILNGYPPTIIYIGVVSAIVRNALIVSIILWR